MRNSDRRKRGRGPWLLVLLICALVMVLSAGYVLRYELNRRDILRRNAGYSALYKLPEIDAGPTPTYAPDFAPEQTPLVTRAPAASIAALSRRPSAAATATASPGPTAPPSPTPEPSPTPTPSPSPVPSPTPTPSLSPSPCPSPSPTPSPTQAVPVDATITPRATADERTVVYAIATPPPAQHSFAKLLELNPETVGFLTIPNLLSLPVAQRPNDNDFYLTHGFDGEESDGGALFLDGANLLTPEDDCLIVYGHNMKNGTMFRPLVQYEDLDFLKEHPLVRFDTIYENRVYAPFAALTVTADPDSERYMNLRLFDLDEPGFDLFVRSLRTLSAWGCPLDVAYGDRLLLLVTCEYTHDNGRFVLALRERRPDESMDELRTAVQEST